jgi:uncharacterized phage-associated protein
LQPHPDKILEAILRVIETGEKTGTPATQFEIAKAIFLADYRHLETYGRPVTYDNFVALEFGPVPSLTYNMLKPEFDWRKLGLEEAPWRTRAAGKKARRYFALKRAPDVRKLSETDLTALDSAFREVRAMGFGKTSDFTHRILAYQLAWAKRGTKQMHPMDLRALLPDFDDEMISDLEHLSKYASV